MRPQPKQRVPFSLKRAIFVPLCAVILGIFLGWVLEQVGPASPIGPLTFLLFFVAAIFFHELGHVLAGLVVHFEVLSFAVGPLMLRRESSGVRFRISPIKLGGLVTIVPVGVHDLRKRMLIMVTGGPASSFLFAGLAFALGLAFDAPLRSNWMNPFAVICGGMGLVALIPTRQFFRSDGAQIWDLLRSPAKAERQCAVLAIAGAGKAGLRPRDWDGALIAKGLSITDNSRIDVAANAIAYEAALDRHEFDLAEEHLKAALTLRHKCPPGLKSGLALDATFFYSMVRHDSSLAHEWFKECNRRDIHEKYSLFMAEAAVLLNDGELSQAAAKARESLSLLPRSQFPGFATAAKDWLDIIVLRAESGVRDTRNVNSEQPGICV